MSLSTEQRLQRLRVRTAEIGAWRVRASRPTGPWTFDGKPIAVGDPWPHRDGVVRFAGSAEVPADWLLDDVRLQLDLGGESRATLAYPDGGEESFGVDPNHQEFPLRGRSFRIEAESVARLPFGEPNRGASLARAAVVLIDPPVRRLHLLLRQIGEAVSALGDHEVVPHLLKASEAVVRGLDWPSETAAYLARIAGTDQQRSIWQAPATERDPPGLDPDQRASVAAACEALTERLRALQERFPPAGKLHLTGHAHIDLAWLWPYGETRRKLRRTFATALSLMERSPDFRFNQSTAHYYAQLETDDPALLDRIKARVAEGRWETVGGLWVEPDTNMPSGESLVRQILYGQRYFERTFGVRHRVCWLPDCFGFSGALPQLLRQGGMDGFFTIKVNWSETNRFPHDLFWWEGIDGSRVLAHTFDNPMHGYNGFVQPDCFVPTWKNFRGKVHHDTSLLAVGYGDGGGGVTPEMVEREVQLRDFPAIPQARWGRIDDFFESLHGTAAERRLPTWAGEIYLELHRATLTTQSGIKRLHRRAEGALAGAEAVASLAHLLGGPAPGSLEDLWRVVLKTEFHDILPGSCIREVAVEAERELSGVLEAAARLQDGAMRALAAQIPAGAVDDALVVVNPTLDPRPLAVTLADGTTVSSGEIVPPLSVAVFDRSALQPAGLLRATASRLENDHLLVEIGPDGAISRLVHKPTGREAFDGAGNQLWVYPVDKPRAWDAWDVDGDYAERGERLDRPESVELVEVGPHRAAIRVTHRWRHSKVVQDYVLAAGARRLDVVTEIDWHDRRAMLRTLNPVAVRARTATFECAFGVVGRATHANTSWQAAMFESVAHRFVDLAEPDFGVALLNDAKYGHSAAGNTLGLSLVRGPVYPDPLADEGLQRFTYALMPHAGTWYAGGVREEAEALNRPLAVMAIAGLAAGVVSPLRVSGTPVALSALKPAEEGAGLILRVYEPAGRRGPLSVAPPEGWRVAGAVTLMEEPSGHATNAGILPFEVRSFRLERG